MRNRLLVVRGDLNSTSGYSQAIELYVARLARHFDVVVGVDLHPNPARFLSRWPYPILQDREVSAALREADARPLVLSITTPDRFHRFPDAHNVGLFFWETSAIHQPRWLEAMSGVDEVWLPSRFMLDALRREGATVPMRHVPCPLEDLADGSSDAERDAEVLLHEIGGDAQSGRMTSLSEVRSRFRFVALSTNTLLPRKGFPILASEWARFARDRRDTALVLKVSSIDVTEPSTALLARTSRLFDRFIARSPGLTPNVFVTTSNLSVSDMRLVTIASDVFVTPTFGEGLGLGAFEALFVGRPVVCPRHTAFAELLPDDYPWWVDCEMHNISLYDPVGLIPPSARWGVPLEGSIAATLRRCLDDVTAGTHVAAIRNATRHAIDASTVDFGALLSTDRREAA